MGRWTLIIGGARSGKSSHALKLARVYKPARFYIATAGAGDEEMRSRILNHQKERGSDFRTIEEQYELKKVFRGLPGESRVVVVDCLTLRVTNLLIAEPSEENIRKVIEELPEMKERVKAPVIWVSNEVGQGIVPNDPLSRRYQDLLGCANQRFAGVSDRVIHMVAGIPISIKSKK
ncbi:MAG: bifunctional adenosylcobinamide kinase/adenosylcobinamide-phosphate guanylyltransferase [bacterium]|nr:bifunctional adenosylcobinamide kinase/adenosylcobinamide-phosphate guanylyltransferase [bacterium]